MEKGGNHLGYLRECFRGYGGRIFATLLFLAAARAASTADPLYPKKIIDGLGANQPLSVLSVAVVGYFTLRVIQFVGEFLRDWTLAPVLTGVGRKVSETVFDYLLRL